MKKLKKIILSGKEVYPIIEGGKGIGVSNGFTAGAFAAADAVGTISGVFPPDMDDEGNLIHSNFKGKNRVERSKEVIQLSINNSLRDIKIAHEISEGKGRIHLNLLWGLAGSEQILVGILEGAKGMLHGITCGAGMPYKLAELASAYKIYYYPIVSSDRAFYALWNRSFKHHAQYLGGVVYEDPWKAGGHNGLSNKENPLEPERPLERVMKLRKTMNDQGLNNVPIVMAGGVWNIQPFIHWIENPEIAPIAFQLGTRPMLTQESPISDNWKNKLLTIREGDVTINRFSSTGFYSSAVKNNFLEELEDRSSRQIAYRDKPEEIYNTPYLYDSYKPVVFVDKKDKLKAFQWQTAGFEKGIKTPDQTLLFLTPEHAKNIKKDQVNCKGCLAACKFSGWADSETMNYKTGILPDPRSFCIMKTLGNIIIEDDVENELMFSGHNTYYFGQDPLYNDGHIPTIKELIDNIIIGK